MPDLRVWFHYLMFHLSPSLRRGVIVNNGMEYFEIDMNTLFSPLRGAFRNEDLKDHVMDVVLNQGIHRHLKFNKPDNTFHQWFEIVTWPGTLIITGDMGTYSFSRIRDMFDFFRGDGINPGYWSEKCSSQDIISPCFTHNEDVAREWFEDVAQEGSGEDEDSEEMFPVDYNDPRGLHDLLEARGYQDHWEVNWKAPSRRFLWCLNAIVYAIKKYDELEETK